MAKATANDNLQERFQNLHEFVPAAREALPRNIWDYLIGAAESETTMKRNRQALDSIAFRPRVLADVSAIDCGTRFLGRDLALPVAVAPVGSLESFDPEGGVAVARGAAKGGVMSMHSVVSQPDLETIAAAADNPKIFQLYVRGDSEHVDGFAARASAAGYDAFCITVDTAVYSRRERDIANRFDKPWRRDATGINYQAAFNWNDVARFKATHDMPLILKGIATAEDALEAVRLGVEVIYVSNHGGRQLDHGRGAMSVLPEIVGAVRGRAQIMVDGGFMRGTDIVKALAAGADLVGLGRLPLFALAAAGSDGMARLFEILRNEVETAMGLLGVSRLDELDPTYLADAAPVDRPHVFSAFPLLGWEDRKYEVPGA